LDRNWSLFVQKFTKLMCIGKVMSVHFLSVGFIFKTIEWILMLVCTKSCIMYNSCVVWSSCKKFIDFFQNSPSYKNMFMTYRSHEHLEWIFSFLHCCTMLYGDWMPVFQGTMLPSSTLIMEATQSSKMPVSNYYTRWHSNPENHKFCHLHKSCNTWKIFNNVTNI